MKESIIQRKSFCFALTIVNLCKQLDEYHQFTLSRQLLCSGTSIGANVEESSAAQSSKDFISKMSIALKEAKETRYWLRLLSESRILSVDYDIYIQGVNELICILVKILKTSRAKLV